MKVSHSGQYDCPCVIAEKGDTAQQVIDECLLLGATYQDEPGENPDFCVQIRHKIGPELWTERSLRGSEKSFTNVNQLIGE